MAFAALVNEDEDVDADEDEGEDEIRWNVGLPFWRSLLLLLITQKCDDIFHLKMPKASFDAK